MDHEPEGATEVVGALRGHPVAHAAKCLLLMAKVDKRTRRFVLAVGPGDRRVDLAAVRRVDRYVPAATLAADDRTSSPASRAGSGSWRSVSSRILRLGACHLLKLAGWCRSCGCVRSPRPHRRR